MLVDLKENKLAMWAVCEAVASQHELIDKMENIEGEGILKDIKFIVGGVELNFLNVIEAIDKNIDKLINEEAKKLIREKFNDLLDKIEEVENDIVEKFEVYTE